MKKNLLTTMALLCAFVLGGVFTSCSSNDDNPSGSSTLLDPIAKKLCREKTWIDKDNIAVQNSLWAYTFNEDGTIQISGLTKFGDPDQLISLNFSGRWKPVYDYKDNYNVVNSNVRPYAVELRLNDFSIDGEETKIDDPTIYKDTLLVEYKNGEIKFNNLDQGTYEITEVKTVAGQTLLKEKITVELPITMTKAEADKYGNVDFASAKEDKGYTEKWFF